MKSKTNNLHGDTLRKEYDFNKLKKGERGKYAEEFQRRTNMVLLEPEVAKVFPTSKDVNNALKLLIKISSNSQGN